VGFVHNAREMDALRKRWTAFTHEPGTPWQNATVEVGADNG
jgi:hypothetical protein